MVITLKDELSKRGIVYNSSLSNRAQDIYFDSTEELCECLGFILSHINRLDMEIPDEMQSPIGYPIADGVTSGGNKMKYGSEYRMYFDTTHNMPAQLLSRLQNDSKNRITGSRFIEACSHLGFKHGNSQNKVQIQKNILSIFNSVNEISAFNYGMSL